MCVVGSGEYFKASDLEMIQPNSSELGWGECNLLDIVREVANQHHQRSNIRYLNLIPEKQPQIHANRQQLCDALGEILECTESLNLTGQPLEVRAFSTCFGYLLELCCHCPERVVAQTRLESAMSQTRQVIQQHKGHMAFGVVGSEMQVLVQIPPSRVSEVK